MSEKSVKDYMDEIQRIVNRGMEDARKSDTGNRLAGIRLRKILQTLKTTADLCRARIIDIRNEIGK